jgi:hypothetical protein
MTHPIAYELPAEVSVSTHQYGAVFFHVGEGRLFAVNQTGARIWSGLEQRQSAEHIAEGLCRDYRIPVDKARTHTAAFIARMEAHRLIARRAA